jgi:hypothetical protein
MGGFQHKSISDMKIGTGRFSRRSSMEVAKFNMAAFDFERMDGALVVAHNSLREIRDSPTLDRLDAAFYNIKGAFMILKYALQGQLRKRLVKDEEKIKNAIALLRDNEGEKITWNDARAVMDMLWDFLDEIYEAKQLSGIGIPKSKYMGAEAKIKKAVEA